MDAAERTAIREFLAQGLSSEDIATRLGIPKMRVAAVKSHTTMGTYAQMPVAADGLGIVDLEEAADAQDLKFGLERDMQDALRRNIHQLDPSLTIVDDGTERHVEAGFIDILAKDDRGSLVVIELKSADAPDTSITQILSYIGSLRDSENAPPVRGILVARDFSNRVRLAARAASIELVTYGYSFTFTTYKPGV